MVLGLSVAGCGPERPQTIGVTGTVTLDGEPLEGAVVGFTPEGGGRPATGTTDAEGRFRLTTFDDGDGALPGRHLVTVAKVKDTAPGGGDRGTPEGKEMLSGGPGFEVETMESEVPQRYTNWETSGLQCEVKKGMDPPTFPLTSDD
jgi:hypothetical protein